MKRTDWDAVFEDYAKSGLSQRAYCQKRKINYGTFIKQRYERRKKGDSRDRGSSQYISFRSTDNPSDRITIRYGEAIRIELGVDQLGRVIKELEQCEFVDV